MDLVLDLLATVSRWSRSNLSEISLALVGCLLVLFGADIKGWVDQRLGSIAGALRVPLIALLCMIGSGAARPPEGLRDVAQHVLRLERLGHHELDARRGQNVILHRYEQRDTRGVTQKQRAVEWFDEPRVYHAHRNTFLR